MRPQASMVIVDMLRTSKAASDRRSSMATFQAGNQDYSQNNLYVKVIKSLMGKL